MLKILQVRLQQYMKRELPKVQPGVRKGRGTRDQISNIHWIIEKTKQFQKNICLIDYSKAFDCVDYDKLWKVLKEIRIADLPPEKLSCKSRSNSYNGTQNNGLFENWERSMSRLYIIILFI